MSGEDVRFGGWRNFQTWHVAMMLKEGDWIYNEMEEMREEGYCAADQKFMLADAMEQSLFDEWQELRKSGKLIFALVMDPKDVDYGALADYFVTINEDCHCFDGDFAASRCTKKPKQSANRKPRTTSGKAPAKKPTNRRR